MADRVRALLADVQQRRRRRRRLARMTAQIRASLRRHKARLKAFLAQWGIRMKGWEFRGARQGIDRYIRYCARVGMPGWKDPPWRLAPAPPG